MRNYTLYTHPVLSDLLGLLNFVTERNPEGIAFQYMEEGEHLLSISYQQFRKDVLLLSSYFRRNGFDNNCIVLLGENSYQWIVCYCAVVLSGNTIVPIDKELDISEIRDLIIRCHARMLLYSDSLQTSAQNLMTQNAVNSIASMKQILLKSQSELAMEWAKTDENAVCTILFTSGTTGIPKGVMLTQRNLVTNALDACRNLCVSGSSLLTLPLNHAFGFTVGVLSELIYGYPICISRSLRTFQKDLVRYQPQNMIVVPLYVEVLYKSIWRRAERERKETKLLWLLRINKILRACGIDVRKRLFRQVLEPLGGRLEQLVCGGAHLEQEYIDGFDEFGIKVLNGYGITECSPVVAVNRNSYWRAKSVGIPLPSAEIRIVDDEICVRGPSVASGYFDDVEATYAAFQDGWFKTGDLGYQDRDGFLYITGRKKNLIILGNGENVSPEELEHRLISIAGIEEAIVFLEDNLICAELYANDTAVIRDSIAALNKQLPTYKRIQTLRFRDTPFQKTSTKKIKRP